MITLWLWYICIMGLCAFKYTCTYLHWVTTMEKRSQFWLTSVMMSNEFQALYLFALYVRFTSDTQDWVALDDEWTSQSIEAFFLENWLCYSRHFFIPYDYNLNIRIMVMKHWRGRMISIRQLMTAPTSAKTTSITLPTAGSWLRGSKINKEATATKLKMVDSGIKQQRW